MKDEDQVISSVKTKGDYQETNKKKLNINNDKNTKEFLLLPCKQSLNQFKAISQFMQFMAKNVHEHHFYEYLERML